MSKGIYVKALLLFFFFLLKSSLTVYPLIWTNSPMLSPFPSLPLSFSLLQHLLSEWQFPSYSQFLFKKFPSSSSLTVIWLFSSKDILHLFGGVCSHTLSTTELGVRDCVLFVFYHCLQNFSQLFILLKYKIKLLSFWNSDHVTSPFFYLFFKCPVNFTYEVHLC